MLRAGERGARGGRHGGFWQPRTGSRVFFWSPSNRTVSAKNQVWQHSYTRVRRPLIIARLTQRTPCPGIWSECRSYALLHEGSLPEVTGSSPIKFGDLPVLSTVIRPFFFVFWLCGRRGGKNRGGRASRAPGAWNQHDEARGADFTGRRPWSIGMVPKRS